MCFVDFGCLIGPFGPNAMVHVANSFNSIQFIHIGEVSSGNSIRDIWIRGVLLNYNI